MRAVALSVIILIGGIVSAREGVPIALIRAIPLPAVEGRVDHLAFDAQTQRLFVAALGNNSVEVVDVKSGVHVKSLPGFHEPQGIASMSGSGLVAVANGAGANVQFVSGADYRPGRSIPVGDDADNIRFDAVTKRLYVGYGDGALAAIDTATGRIAARVNLPGHPESFQLERTGTRIFVNVPTAARVVVVDRQVMEIVAQWPLTAASSNFPMALDEAGHRLFVGCRQPAAVLVFDTIGGKQIAAIDAVGDSDDLFYDAAQQRLYVTGGEGFIDAFDAREPTKLDRIAHVRTAAGARTSLFVPELRRLFLAVPHRGAQKAEVRVYDVGRSDAKTATRMENEAEGGTEDAVRRGCRPLRDVYSDRCGSSSRLS